MSIVWHADGRRRLAASRLGVHFDPGSTQVGCNFEVSAGTGVVPTAALQALGAGAGSFDIQSKRTTSEKLPAPDGSTWSFSSTSMPGAHALRRRVGEADVPVRTRAE